MPSGIGRSGERLAELIENTGRIVHDGFGLEADDPVAALFQPVLTLRAIADDGLALLGILDFDRHAVHETDRNPGYAGRPASAA